MQKSGIPKLPSGPGVYLFKNQRGDILYIGRATSLKSRVASYFRNDLLETRGTRLVDMVTLSENIEFFETDSVLEAIILEANLIKKHQPHYNTLEKDDKSFNYVVVTKEAFPKVIVIRERELENALAGVDSFGLPTRALKVKAMFGPFPQGGIIRDGLRIIRKIFPFHDGSSIKKDQLEFYKQIGLTPDLSQETVRKNYKKNIKNIILFFQGKKDRVIRNLQKDMKYFADRREFEMAGVMRNRIFALKHIHDVSLIKREELLSKAGNFRIEAYDVSHISGTSMAGVMTVITDGRANKNEYRKFRIRGFDSSNDVGALEEIMKRRLGHPEWLFPNLVVVDGSTAQKRRVENLFNQLGLQIPVVAVVKNEKHKPKALLGKKEIALKYEKEIILANAEAHRFSVAYHQYLRGAASGIPRVKKKY